MRYFYEPIHVKVKLEIELEDQHRLVMYWRRYTVGQVNHLIFFPWECFLLIGIDHKL